MSDTGGNAGELVVVKVIHLKDKKTQGRGNPASSSKLSCIGRSGSNANPHNGASKLSAKVSAA